MKKITFTPPAHLLIYLFALFVGLHFTAAQSYSFDQSQLNFTGSDNVNAGVTGMMWGPDDRLYVVEYTGSVKIMTISRNSSTDYVVTDIEQLDDIKTMPDHNDDGSSANITNRETIGIVVGGTAANPVFYVSSSDFRIGAGTNGGNGDVGLDTNSGVITRFTWNGSSWDVVDIVRGLPRSEENHATNGLDLATINGTDYLIVASGGITNAGGPSVNFVYTCEYALSGAVLSVNLDMINSMNIKNDNGRQYIYDLPTLDDPTRANVNGITDPDAPGYNGVDVNDPWGGNDGLNMAVVDPSGPVQILSPGYRNAYDLVVTESGALYVTDNGANQGWGGFPVGEGTANVTNDYDPSEPGSNTGSNGEGSIDNVDHLQLVTTDLQTYTFGSLYGGHPNPVRANPNGAGLYTNDDNGNAVFRTQKYDPDGSTPGSTTNPALGLPANWPPVAVANPDEGDWRGPTVNNPDGPEDNPVVTWGTNTNGIVEYTASNFGGDLKGSLLAGHNGGYVRRVELSANGASGTLTQDFFSGVGGDGLGIDATGDDQIFPGTVWVGTLNGKIVVFEPQDFVQCTLPGEPGYDALADYDTDGYTNQDEEDNGTDACSGGSQPNDFDKAQGGTLVSDLNDDDDDFDGIPDAQDPFQLGDPSTGGSDAFTIPIKNDLFNTQQGLGGIFGLGMTGLMNNGDTGANWLSWLDRRDDENDPNPNDVLGGAPGIMTSHMTSGTAQGTTNTQEKGYQYGVQSNSTLEPYTVIGGMNGFTGPLRLYGNTDAVGGELGFYIGDGTQSNYIKFVVNVDGFIVQQEINDVPQTAVTANLPVGDRPTNTGGIRFYMTVDPATGTVDFEYRIDNNDRVLVASLVAQGSILQAIQNQASDLAVGMIGTSGVSGVELEGSWDYIYVQNENPYSTNTLEDIVATVGESGENIDLFQYFDDNGGAANLSFTVTSNTNPVIGASISSNLLTLTYPNTSATTEITIRATDEDNFFAEQQFSVLLTDAPNVLYRINAGGGDETFNGQQFQSEIDPNDVVYYEDGKTFSNLNTNLPAIYQTERSALPPYFTYNFPVSNGTYTVLLHFAEIFYGATGGGTGGVGSRVFDIWAEGLLQYDDFDILSETGPETPLVKSFDVTVDDGQLTLFFEGLGSDAADQPKVSAIEILGAPEFAAINIDPIVDQSNTEGDIIQSLGVTATGGDPTANFTYAIQGQPNGISMEPTNGLIFGTIANGASSGGPNNDGIHQVTVTVSKPGSNTVTEDFQWSVAPPQGPFTIVDVDDQQNASGDSVSVSAIASGGDTSKPVIYQLSGAPQGLSIDSNGLINGEIANNAHTGGTTGNGDYSVTVIASREGSSDVQTQFSWTVTEAVQQNDFWTDKNEPTNYTKRHECSFVQAGDKFYLMGGRENAQDIDVYDYQSNTWTTIDDSAPLEFNHYQAVEYEGLIWVIGAFKTNAFPSEIPAEHIWAFNPANETWFQGPTIPANRRRGSAGLAVYNNKFYIVAGNENGHNASGNVNWFDEYDPATGQWTVLPDAPNDRDHFHAVVIGNKLYAAGGRQSSFPVSSFKPVVTDVDVYDFTTGSWSTLPSNLDIPTGRGGVTAVNFNSKLVVMGGEVDGEEVYGETVSGALTIVEEFNPTTNQWQRLDDLNHPRHGTQAIASGSGIFILGGSPQLGGGNQHNMEYYASDSPAGQPSVASSLNLPNEVEFAPGETKNIQLDIAGGNIGVMVQSIGISGSTSYNIVAGELTDTFLMPGDSHTISVQLSNNGAGEQGLLNIEYDDGSEVSVVLFSGDLQGQLVNPGTQFNAEGDVVSLPIQTTNPQINYTFSATNLPPTLTIDSNTGVISGTVLEETSTNGETDYYIEQNGLLVIEAENGDITGWGTTTQGNEEGIVGNSNHFGFPNGGKATYEVSITTTGVYRFDWNSLFSGDLPTEENDSWLKFDNNSNVWFFGLKGTEGTEAQIISNVTGGDPNNIVFPIGSGREDESTTPEGNGSQGYFKVYRSGGTGGVYDWQSRTSDNDPHEIYVYFVSPGNYTFTIGERSEGHAIDKIVLYKVDGPDYTDNELDALPESPSSNSTIPGAAENSPYSVSVSAVDPNDAGNNDQVDFTWIIGDPGSDNDPVAMIDASATTVVPNETINFSGDNSFDPDGSIVSYVWDFGDGTTANGSNVSHAYAIVGNYAATLTVTDNSGQQNSIAELISVQDPDAPSEGVSSMVLLNSANLSVLTQLTNNLVIQNSEVNGLDLNIYANTVGNVGSVILNISGPVNESRTESVAPYALFGDTGGVPFPVGSYTATATAYAQSGGGGGQVGLPLVINFTITDGPINELPVAVANANPISGDIPLTVTFNGNSSTDDGSIIDYAWDFGDGNSGSGAVVNHTYTGPGIFTATLTVTDDGNQQNSDTVVITAIDPNVNLEPVANINATPTLGDMPLLVNFDGSGSTDEDDDIVSFIWNFGDGSTANGATVSHTYTVAGTYSASLTVTDGGGLSNTANTTITVIDPDAPLAGVSGLTLLNAANLQTITNLTDGLDIPAATVSGLDLNIYATTVDNVGSVVLSISGPVNNTRTESVAPYGLFGDNGGEEFPEGNYTATATAFSQSGGGGSQVGQPFVVNFSITSGPIDELPVAVATADLTTGDIPLEVAFDGSASSDDSAISTYSWDFGDGNTATGPNASHTYTIAGVYTATLTVTDDGGQQNSDTVVITAIDPNVNLNPDADISATPIAGDLPLPVSFDASGSTDEDDDIVSYIWNFGDGTTTTNSSDTNSHTYTTAGTFTASVTVIDGGGLSDTASVTITVTDPNAPVEGVTGLTLLNGNNQQPITNLSDGQDIAFATVSGIGLNIYAETNGSVGSVILSISGPVNNTRTESVAPYGLFGDTGSASFPVGSYTATATAYSQSGGGGTQVGVPFVVNFTISDGPVDELPVAVASANPTTGDIPLVVSFDGSASTDDSAVTAYSWNFGDGNGANGATASHTYTTAGSYTATLTVTDDGGQQASDSVVITVIDPNAPAEGVTGLTLLNGSNQQPITNLSDGQDIAFATVSGIGLNIYAETNGIIGSVILSISGPVNNTRIESVAPYGLFGDTGSASFPVGSYTATATAYSQSGGGGTLVGESLVVNFTISDGPVDELPVAVASANPTTGDIPLVVSFDGSASTDDSAITAYSWNFGDGNGANGATASHTYTAAGSYTATLTVTDDAGQQDTDSVVITVIDPNAPEEGVVGLTLIDANTDSDIAVLANGQTFSESLLTAANIGANTNGNVGSVVLTISGVINNTRTESVAPYALFGDQGGDYLGVSFLPGLYTVSATAYSQSGGNGTVVGTTKTVDFEVSSAASSLKTSADPVSLPSILTLYPNPANTFVSIFHEHNKQVDEVEVFDMTGRLVHRKKASGDAVIELDVSGLQAGVYQIQLIGTTINPITAKLLVKHN